jgi:hypothetical protein
MLKKLLPIVLFVFGAVLLYVYFQTRLPPGFESKGADDWMPVVTLVSSIVTTVGGIVTTTLQILQHRKG